jgi:hypothetical protein
VFGLPKSTEINRPLPKKAVFEKFKPNATERKLFDDQISRLAIISEISPQTVSIAASRDVPAIYVILVILKAPKCDKKSIALISKLIDQRMLFAIQYEDEMRFAVYRSERVFISESKKLDECKLNLRGLDLRVVWENIIADICDVNISGGKSLDETIAAKERRDKLIKQIADLENKAMNERQPRRKWEYAENIRRLKAELEGIDNG